MKNILFALGASIMLAGCDSNAKGEANQNKEKAQVDNGLLCRDKRAQIVFKPEIELPVRMSKYTRCMDEANFSR